MDTERCTSFTVKPHKYFFYNLDKMCWTEGLSLGVLQAYDITSSRFLLMVKSPPIWRGSSSTPAKAVGNCLPCNKEIKRMVTISFVKKSNTLNIMQVSIPQVLLTF